MASGFVPPAKKGVFVRRSALPLLLALAACSAPTERAVEDAWVRLPAASGRPGAAYFTVKGGAKDATLTAVATPAAERAELHSMSEARGMMRMAPVPGLAVPAEGEVRLAPGGLHVMLFGLRPGLAPGGTLPLTLRFADGGTLATEAKLVGAGDPAP